MCQDFFFSPMLAFLNVSVFPPACLFMHLCTDSKMIYKHTHHQRVQKLHRRRLLCHPHVTTMLHPKTQTHRHIIPGCLPTSIHTLRLTDPGVADFSYLEPQTTLSPAQTLTLIDRQDDKD